MRDWDRIPFPCKQLRMEFPAADAVMGRNVEVMWLVSIASAAVAELILLLTQELQRFVDDHVRTESIKNLKLVTNQSPGRRPNAMPSRMDCAH